MPYQIHKIKKPLKLKLRVRPPYYPSRTEGFELAGVHFGLDLGRMCLRIISNSRQLEYTHVIWKFLKTKTAEFGPVCSELEDVEFNDWAEVEAYIRNKLDYELINSNLAPHQVCCEVRISLFCSEEALMWWFNVERSYCLQLKAVDT